jgi:hypothetical protein
MRLLCMTVYMYNYIYMCVILQFKTGVKLKWECVEPLVQSNFWWLDKNCQNRSIIFSAA